MSGDDDQPIETTNPGVFAKLNGKCVVSYEEVIEETSSTIKNLIKFDENTVEVTRRGDFNVHIIFEKDKKSQTNYNTPFGALVVGFDTHQIIYSESEDHISISIKYDMDINYEHVASCNIDIVIKNAQVWESVRKMNIRHTASLLAVGT